MCQAVGDAVMQCADIKLSANAKVHSCDFTFEKDKCGGSKEKEVSVKRGKDSNGVHLKDQVKFVSVNCKK